MKLLLRISVAALAVLGSWFAGPAATAAVVNAGQHFLAPNAQGQQIAVLVTGGEAAAGLDFFVQIGDGGAAAGGVDTGPTITQVDLLAGAIFSGNNTGVFVDPAPLLWGATTTTLAGTVTAAGRLATLTIDTTGIFTGRYDLILDPPATGPTQLIGAPTTLLNGWLQIGSPQAGDFDEDGDVDAADLLAWRAGFGGSGAATHMQGDADSDLDVDGADLLIWQGQFDGGASVAAGRAVPEPAAILVAAASGLGLRGRRRSR